MRLACWFRMALAAAVLSGWAEPVSSDLVVRAVNTLIAQDGQMECPIEGSVSSVRLCAATNGAAFYVAKLTGGGFVVTSTDTEIDPVIAVSSAPDLVEDSRNPLWALLVHDMALRQESVAVKSKSGVRQKSGDGSGNDYISAAAARWARLTTSGANLRLGKNAGRNAISDVRVAPLLKTKWGQSTDASGRKCFNYYTPNGSLCGCTATACAQIFRYHKFPKVSVEPRTYECKVDGYSRTLTQKGGVYDWNNMPNVPGSGTTDKQRRAIGKLTYDVGLAVRAEYKRQSTSAYPYLIPNLCHEWGYAHATWYYDYDYGYKSLTKAQLKSVLIPNLDANLPVQVSIRGSSSGHSVVADGYGYWDGSFSVHLNFGWDGNSDAWYVLPGTISAGGHEYTGIGQLCGNIYPNGPSRGGIVSGRVLSFSTSKPVSGIVVTARSNYGGVLYAMTNEKGIYSFVLPMTADDGQGDDGGGKKQFCFGNVNWEYESSMDWDISLENALPTSDSESTASYPLRIYDCRNYYDRDFSVRIYTVKFDANGGSGGVVSRKCNVLGTLPTTKRTGYTFKGWFTAPDGGTEVTASTLPANNATYYAQWRANPYTVAFDANGGTGTMAPMDFAYDEPQVLRANAFVKGNAAFRGWSLRPRRRVAFADGESVKNLTAEADGIVTLYAVWDGDAVAADVGEYFKATLAELGCGVPVDGTPYTVVAKGLPAGLKLKYNAAVKDKKGKVVTKAKSTWWIEGVPTAALDYATNPPYLVITVNGEATTEPLLLEALAQHVMELGELTLGESVNTKGWLMGVEAGWSVSGLPTGLKFATKKITKKSGTKTVIVAEAYSVYGKTTKAGLFTITAKKKKGAYYETMKYRVLVTPKAVDAELFGDSLTNITTMA
ncbi:MAG: C10 family peptidase, partial [Kiritimatiellae bacterium]|nr:C10 family peptidase [Kiritimatiellia bacterium]